MPTPTENLAAQPATPAAPPSNPVVPPVAHSGSTEALPPAVFPAPAAPAPAPATTPAGHTPAVPTPALGLDLIEPGSKGVVRAVGGDPLIRRRLLEMGFVAGTVLRVVRLAPLGDPMQIELHGCHLSLRRSEARAILVQPA